MQPRFIAPRSASSSSYIRLTHYLLHADISGNKTVGDCAEKMSLIVIKLFPKRLLAPRMRKTFAFERHDAAYIFFRHRDRFNFKNTDQLPLFIFS